MFRERGKQSFFALHQIHEKIKRYDVNVDVEFHILWDCPDKNENKKWIDLINNYGFNITSYDKEFFLNYCKQAYDLDIDIHREKFSKFCAIYLLLSAHYLRRVKMYDYYLIYDDDILINYDFVDVIEAMLNKVPVLISEPFNAGCDKVLLNPLINLYEPREAVEIYKHRNPNILGFNAGFQGIDLTIYDDFLSKNTFDVLLSLFDYSGIYDKTGKEIWGHARHQLDTQQQSLFSSLNLLRARKNPLILNPTTCYVAPSWGKHPYFGEINSNDELHGWGVCLNSKISHFVGHTHGKGKPKEFLDKVDKYLKLFNFL